VLFGQNPPLLQLPFPPTSAFPDPGDYSCQLHWKLMDMWEIVEANATKSVNTQKNNHAGQNKVEFVEGQRMFLDNQTRGKLDPCWTGPSNIKRPITLELQMDPPGA